MHFRPKKSLLVLILRSPRFSEATKKIEANKKRWFCVILGFGAQKRVKCSFLTNVFNLTFNQHKMTFHLSYCKSLYDNFFPLYIVCTNLPNAVARWGLLGIYYQKEIAKKKIAHSPRFFAKGRIRTNLLFCGLKILNTSWNRAQYIVV